MHEAAGALQTQWQIALDHACPGGQKCNQHAVIFKMVFHHAVTIQIHRTYAGSAKTCFYAQLCGGYPSQCGGGHPVIPGWHLQAE